MTDKNRTVVPALVLAFAAFLPCLDVHAADKPRTPSAVLAALSDRIYVLGETSGKPEDMIAAEADAAEEIGRYIAGGATEGLLATGKDKRSPLATAAYMGYPNVAAALLTSELVRSRMNEADDVGMTPWIASNLSMQQSAWACNPSLFDNPFALVPLLVTQAYYLRNPAPPYQATRQALERAGALRNPDRAKQVWTAVCKNQAPEVKAKIQGSADLQKTVQELGLSALGAHVQEAQQKLRDGRRK